MKFRSKISVIFCLYLFSSSCRQASDDAEVAMELRRYSFHEIFVTGGSTPEQKKLYQAFQKSSDEGKESELGYQFPVFRRAFELCDIDFPEGANVIVSPADTHMYFRHNPAMLDEIEKRFGMTSLPIPEMNYDLPENPFSNAEQDAAQ